MRASGTRAPVAVAPQVLRGRRVMLENRRPERRFHEAVEAHSGKHCQHQYDDRGGRRLARQQADPVRALVQGVIAGAGVAVLDRGEARQKCEHERECLAAVQPLRPAEDQHAEPGERGVCQHCRRQMRSQSSCAHWNRVSSGLTSAAGDKRARGCCTAYRKSR